VLFVAPALLLFVVVAVTASAASCTAAIRQ
jgi:hypothetical protein